MMKKKLISIRRWHMWWSEGKKDGMCGINRETGPIPKAYREAYNFGHTYGMLSREAAYHDVV